MFYCRFVLLGRSACARCLLLDVFQPRVAFPGSCLIDRFLIKTDQGHTHHTSFFLSLSQNLRKSCWNKAAHFFDLPDFLSWKATGCLTR